MTDWTDEQLRRIATAEELEIAPVRRNGELRSPTPIWVVPVDGELYVRGANAAATGWWKVARTSGRAHIAAGGLELDVTIEDADPGIYDAVDDGYRTKYGDRYRSIVQRINDDEHRTTTLRLAPTT